MYVYFLRTKGRIKIGKARNPIERMKTLQTGCPTEITLAGAIRCKSDSHALRVEKRFHEYFAARHKRGEWFQCTDPVLTKIWEILNQLADGKDIKALSALDFERLTSASHAS